MSDTFRTSIAGDGDSLTMTLSGELDLSAIETFDAAVAELGAGLRSVTVDLAGLTFIDSSGIGCLIRAQQASTAGGWTLELRSPTPMVRRVLDVIDLGASIPIID